MARIGAERDTELDLSCLFNDRRVGSRQVADAPGGADAAGLREELYRTTLTWGEHNNTAEQKAGPLHQRCPGRALLGAMGGHPLRQPGRHGDVHAPVRERARRWRHRRYPVTPLAEVAVRSSVQVPTKAARHKYRSPGS